MLWLGLGLLVAVSLTPLGLAVRGRAAERGRREAAMALHRAQLAELDRDLAERRIAPPEHAGAQLELQRRLLSAAAEPEAAPVPAAGSRGPLILAAVLIPVAAFGLYLVGGSPWLPETSLAERIARAEAQARDGEVLLAQLRQRLGQLDPRSEQARQGYVLLGNVEAQRGEMAAAAEAWNTALSARFDPMLAAVTAEAMTEASGRVTEEAAALFRRALAEAPTDAPWRPMAERRLNEVGQAGG